MKEIKLEIIELDRPCNAVDLLDFKKESPLKLFYEAKWKKEANIMMTFKIDKKKFALVDISDPTYWAVFNQFCVFNSSYWTHVSSVALMPYDDAINFLDSVKANWGRITNIKIV